MSGLEAINRDLKQQAPVLFQTLSPLGQQAFFPPDIPFQAQEARGTTYNGTIGVFTDGHGQAVPLPSMAAALELSPEDQNRAFLYSPLLGVPEVRDGWRGWQRGAQGDLAPTEDQPSTLPVVTAGLTHGLSLAADLFGGPGRVLAVASPFWGNYRQIFTLRTGTEVRTAPGYLDGAYDPLAVASILADLPAGEPALALVNFPSNPGGYSPTVAERQQLRDSLLREAERRPLVVLCDDAYSGLVFAPGVPNRSFFWELAGAHEQLIPIKLDGATKEFAFFGGRVGFFTLGLELSPAAQAAFDNKVQCLVRSTIGSPGATSQLVLMQALRASTVVDEVTAIRDTALRRYEAVQPALAALDDKLLRPLPFNAGFFVLMQLAPGVDLDPHEVRRHLIAEYDTGIVAAQPNYLRVALCSVAAAALPEMIVRIERAVGELAARG